MPTRSGVFLYSKFNLSALLSLAEELRGIPCSCDPSVQPACGSFNWAILLSFEDGVEWIFRSPRPGQHISPETTADLLESEVATLKYVKLNTSIPVPQVFDYSRTKFNSIGIPFILMSKAPGLPLSKYSWNACPEGIVSSRKPLPCLTRISKEKIIKQLGAISSQLLNLRFHEIGSLFEENGEYRPKKCLSPALIWHERDCLGDEIARGPYHSDQDYYEALLSAFLLHIKELPLEQHAFFAPVPVLSDFKTVPRYRSAVSRWNDFVAVGSKIDSSKNRLDYCTVGTFLRAMISSITRESFTTLSSIGSGFPLYHPDLSTSNIFVDDDFNITCIIDWAFCSTVPVSTLLMIPSLPHPRDEIDMTLVPTFAASFADHFSQIMNIELGLESWESIRRPWLFIRLVTLDSLQDYHHFTELYTSVYHPEDVVNISRLFQDVQKEEEFLELAKVLTEDDRSPSQIREKEETYFCSKHSGREAIARKLTISAELSKGFVADKRLWRWIEEAIEIPGEEKWTK